MSLINKLISIHDRGFTQLGTITDKWLLGLLARLTFFAVLYFYFVNSFSTKIGDGFFGFLSIADSAYYQIALPAVDAAGGDISAISFLPWGLIVHLGTYAEFLLPLLIVLGLFTRLAAIAMIGFVAVQTVVDITVHMVDSATVGALFDIYSDSLIADQRTLWLFLLLYLVFKGAGTISLDAILSAKFKPTLLAQR